MEASSIATNLPLFPRHNSCQLCPLHTSVKSVGIPTIWDELSLPPSKHTPALVWVGQNPGGVEDEQGVPFVGPSGRCLRGSNDYRELSGQTRIALDQRSYKVPSAPGVYIDSFPFRGTASLYYTNTARCATFGDTDPSSKSFTACFPHTLADLTTIASLHSQAQRVLIALGAPAAAAVWRTITGKKRSLTFAMSQNLTVHPIAGSPWTLFATYHPSYLLRNAKIIYPISDHLQLLWDHLSGLTPLTSKPHLISPRFLVKG